MSSLGVENVDDYSIRSLRMTKPSEIFKQTQIIEVCRRLLVHSDVSATIAYLEIHDSDVL